MADDPIEETEDDGTTEDIEAASDETPLQADGNGTSEPVPAVPSLNRRSATGTIKVGS
jgi:hypothetical protein